MFDRLFREASGQGMEELTTLDELETVIARSADRAVILFKHSPTCGTSAQAEEEIQGLLALGDPGADFYVVSVRRSRPLSDAIAERFGIRHESPQALLVRSGEVRWHASHFRVSAVRIADAIRASEGSAAPA